MFLTDAVWHKISSQHLSECLLPTRANYELIRMTAQGSLKGKDWQSAASFVFWRSPSIVRSRSYCAQLLLQIVYRFYTVLHLYLNKSINNKHFNAQSEAFFSLGFMKMTVKRGRVRSKDYSWRNVNRKVNLRNGVVAPENWKQCNEYPTKSRASALRNICAATTTLHVENEWAVASVLCKWENY